MTSSEPGSSLEEELLSLRLAVSNAVDLWALVEHELAFLLQAIIKDESGQIGLAIYYAPTNTETRIRVVDVAIKAAMGNRPHGGALVYCWQDLYRKIGQTKGTRNKVAHWYTSQVSINGNGPFIRLIDPSKLNLMSRSRQLPGMSAHDLGQYCHKLEGLLKMIGTFGGVLTETMVLRQSVNEWLPYFQKFHDMVTCLGIKAPTEDLGWPPIPPDTAK